MLTFEQVPRSWMPPAKRAFAALLPVQRLFVMLTPWQFWIRMPSKRLSRQRLPSISRLRVLMTWMPLPPLRALPLFAMLLPATSRRPA